MLCADQTQIFTQDFKQGVMKQNRQLVAFAINM
jgi:hypothetical protein